MKRDNLLEHEKMEMCVDLNNLTVKCQSSFFGTTTINDVLTFIKLGGDFNLVLKAWDYTSILQLNTLYHQKKAAKIVNDILEILQSDRAEYMKYVLYLASEDIAASIEEVITVAKSFTIFIYDSKDEIEKICKKYDINFVETDYVAPDGKYVFITLPHDKM